MPFIDSQKKSDAPVRLIVIAFISLIFLGISFNQMWIGYSHMAGSKTAFMASLGIVTGLFFVNIWFAKELAEGKSGSKLLMAYLLLTVMSFAGNFNAFYSFFMNENVLREEVIEKHNKFNELAQKALLALEDQKEVNLTNFVNSKMQDLEQQIRDPKNQGLGSRAEIELQTIEAKLDHIFTRLRWDNSPDELVNRYKKMIQLALEAKLNEQIPKRREKVALSAEIENMKSNLAGKVVSAQKNIKEDGLPLIQEIINNYKEVGIKTNNLSGNFKFEKNLEPDNAQVGTIPHSFGSAFGKNITRMSTWFLALLSLFIDLGIPLITFLITKQEKPAGEDTNIFIHYR